jgi:hypothetical protein
MTISPVLVVVVRAAQVWTDSWAARLFYHDQLGTDSHLSMVAASSYILNGAKCGLALCMRRGGVPGAGSKDG